MRVSYFRKLVYVFPHKTTDVRNILTDIKNGRYAEQIATLRNISDKHEAKHVKRNLPYFTASGTFKKRDNDFLLDHSGLIQIDVDEPKDLKKCIEIFRADRFTFSCFVSPSGTGVKALVKIEPSRLRHRENFENLYTYYKNRYGIIIDIQCSDISRPFYVSYDPELYLNENSDMFVNSQGKEGNPISISMDPVKFNSSNLERISKAVDLIPPKIQDDGRESDYKLIIQSIKQVFGSSRAEREAYRLLANSTLKNEIPSILSRSVHIRKPTSIIFGEMKKQGVRV